jgi:hypothetical protein
VRQPFQVLAGGTNRFLTAVDRTPNNATTAAGFQVWTGRGRWRSRL